MWIDKIKQDPYGRLEGSTPVNLQVGQGGGTAQPGSATNNPPSQNPLSPTPPTQEFATVQDYLKGNQQQGEQLGQKVVSSLGESLGKEKNAISGAAGQAKSDISGSTTTYDPSLVSLAANDPTKVAGNPGQLDAFLKQWNASYSGPSSFETSSAYAPASAALSDAQTKRAQTETAGGQQQLIQDQFNVYGQGNKGLDQALLQTSGAFPQLQRQAKEFGTIQDYLGQQTKDVNAQAAQAKATTDQTRAQTQGAFTNKLTEFQTGLNEKVAAKKAEAQKVADKYKTDLIAAGQTGGDSAALIKDISDAGASPKELQTLKDYFSGLNSYKMSGDLSNFATVNPNVDVTAANVATPEDYAKAAAYQKLTGVNYGGVLNPADATAATQPAFVPRPNHTLLELQKLADAQIKNFGSADQGLLNQIKSLTDMGTNTPTQADANFQPAKNPFDVQGLTGYLKGQVGPRDQQLLSGDINNAVTTALNSNPLPAGSSPMEGLNLIKTDPQRAQTVANTLLAAAARSGDINAVNKFYQQIARMWMDSGTTNNRATGPANPTDPKIAGYLTALNTLGQQLGYPEIEGYHQRIGENGRIQNV